jgi:hypothetical protein
MKSLLPDERQGQKTTMSQMEKFRAWVLSMKNFWTVPIVLMMVTESAIAWNLDAYSASMPAWFTAMGWSETTVIIPAVGLSAGVAIGCLGLGSIAAGPLIHHYQTRKVQFGALTVMLLTAVWSTTIEGWVEMTVCQGIRDFACAVGIIACGVRARNMLPQNQSEQLKGLGQLNVWSYGFSALAAMAGPLLVTYHMDWWRWLGPAISLLGLLELVFNKNHPEVVEEAGDYSIVNRDVFKLVMPTLGVSLAQGAVTTYIILDVGASLGAPVRAAINIAAGLAGVVIPRLVEKWGDKQVVRALMVLAVLSVPCVLAKTMVTLVFAGLALGMAQVGISLILIVKRPNTGSSASTHEVTNYSAQTVSALAWGGVRQSFGVNFSYAMLIPILVVCHFMFEKWFRTPSVWNPRTS